MLHNSHWGMICPSETPEGTSTGLAKNLSLMTVVSKTKYAKKICVFLEDHGITNLLEM